MILQSVDFTPSVPDQVFTTVWGQVPLQIEAHWNARGGFWACHLTRADTGEQVIRGMVLTIGIDLLAPYSFGLGRLVGVNSFDGVTNPTLDTLGAAVRFWWAP